MNKEKEFEDFLKEKIEVFESFKSDDVISQAICLAISESTRKISKKFNEIFREIMTEKQLQKLLQDWLDLQDDLFSFGINGGGFQTKSGGWFKATTCTGVADILCCLNGKFVAFEVKLPKKYQQPNQKVFESEVKKVNGHYFVVHSLEELMGIVEGLRNENRY